MLYTCKKYCILKYFYFIHDPLITLFGQERLTKNVEPPAVMTKVPSTVDIPYLIDVDSHFDHRSVLMLKFNKRIVKDSNKNQSVRT